MENVTIRRLGVEDAEVARTVFAVMAEVFEEESGRLGEEYLRGLLRRADFRVLAAMAGEEVVGGITAFVLPLTRREEREFFIYDLAVREEWQRKGIGRRLVEQLREEGREEGIAVTFVLADNEDEHAVEFYRAIGGQGSGVTAFTFAGE